MAESNDSEVVASAVLAMLQDHGGKVRRDRLASRLNVQIRLLDPVVDVLEGEGKIRVELGRKGGMIFLTRPN
jgi:hypothetical protein